MGSTKQDEDEVRQHRFMNRNFPCVTLKHIMSADYLNSLVSLVSPSSLMQIQVLRPQVPHYGGTTLSLCSLTAVGGNRAPDARVLHLLAHSSSYLYRLRERNTRPCDKLGIHAERMVSRTMRSTGRDMSASFFLCAVYCSERELRTTFAPMLVVGTLLCAAACIE